MSVVRACFALVFAALLLAADAGSAEGAAEKEATIFPSGPPKAAEGEEFRPTTSYWKVAMTVAVGPSEPASWFRMTLPISDGRQAILSREIVAEGLTMREILTNENILAEWVNTTPQAARAAEVTLLAEVTDRKVKPPDGKLGRPRVPEPIRRYLEASAFIQSGNPKIRARAKEIVRSARRYDEAFWALYQYTASFLGTDPKQEKLDALSVLSSEKGTITGKARLLVALLRSLGIPARMVGGIRLADATKTRSTISWMEAWIDGNWFPMDPGGGHFGMVPNDYLELYRGDLPLIVHRGGLDLDYEIVVRQVRRKSVFEDQPSASSALKPIRRDKPSADGERIQTVASYLKNAVATVVVLSDKEVAPRVLERMREDARKHEINLVLLIARFQSRYFRQSTLQRMAEANLDAIRDAHLLLVNSRDESGLYGLLGLGDGKIQLNDSRILVTGAFTSPVGRILGSVLYKLFDPGELAVFPENAELLKLWEVSLASLTRGASIVEESGRWGYQVTVIDELSFLELSEYRRVVVRAWANAVRAQVPLPALNLILVLPIIAFVVVLFRNFIGIDTFGTFSPVIVSLSFLTTGLWWGLVIFVVIVGLGVALRSALQRLRLHMVARLAILVGLVSMIMTGLTVLGAYLGIGALLQISLFPMVIMSNLIENFTVSQVEFGTRHAIRVTLNTLFVCICCYAVVDWTGLPSILLAFPELLLLVLVLEVGAGKWRGLRLMELRRFYDLLRRTRGGAR